MKTQQDVLLSTAGYGRFQMRITALVVVMGFLLGLGMMMSSVFMIFTPDHRCYLPGLDDDEETLKRNSSNQQYPQFAEKNTSSKNCSGNATLLYFPVEVGVDGNCQSNKCYMYNWSTTTSDLNATTSSSNEIPCDNGWKYFVRNGLLTASMEFNLVCDRLWIAPLVQSSLMIGCIAGSFFGGYISDRYGRRFAILFGWTIVCSSSLIFAVAPMWIFLHILTFGIGFGGTIRANVAMVLMSEITPTKHRYMATTLNVLSFGLGNACLPGVAYLFPNWRHMALFIGASQLAILLPSFFILENSLSWFLENKLFDKAKKLTEKAAKINKRRSDKKEVKALQEENEDDYKKKTERTESSKLSFLDLFKIGFLRKRILILALAWSAANTLYFGLSINTRNLGGNVYLTYFALAIVETPGTFLAFFLMRKFGGRLIFMILTAGCGLCVVATPFLQTVSHLAMIAANVLGKLLVSGSMTVLYSFTGDVFPTLLRSQAFGLCSSVSRGWNVLVPYLLFLGEIVHPSIPYLVMGTLGIAAAFAVYLLPETKLKPLPDTLEDARQQERLRSSLSCFRPRGKESNSNPASAESISL
ncbi:organic cation transporter protein-like [Clavelina lepadiformis]|uniref:organic cation transporter protein-like n=1 Tax=Clavelina lepadiformis TaxID=159417 RepID=UPI00404260AA